MPMPYYEMTEEDPYRILTEPPPPRQTAPLIQRILEGLRGTPPPVPSYGMGIRASADPYAVQSIAATPPEPGRNLLNPYIPGTRENWEKERFPNPLTTAASENPILQGFGVGSIKDWGKSGRQGYMNLLSEGRESEGWKAAIKDPETGKIYTGAYHPLIIDTVARKDPDAGARLQRMFQGSAGYEADTAPYFGFINDKGEFLTRFEAEKVFPKKSKSAFAAGTGYESTEFYDRLNYNQLEMYKNKFFDPEERSIESPWKPPAKKSKMKGAAPLVAGGSDFLSFLKNAKESILPSGPSIPPSPTPEVQSITATPPEGQTIPIPGTRAFGAEWDKLPSQYAQTSMELQKAIGAVPMDSPYYQQTEWGTAQPSAPDQLMPGTGLTALETASELGRNFAPGRVTYPGMGASWSEAALMRNPVEPTMPAVDRFSDIIAKGGKNVVDKMVKAGIPTGFNKPEDFVAVMRGNPAFQSLPVMERIRIASRAERIPREGLYSDEGSIAAEGNLKTKGSRIVAGDTIRGCANGCYNCYALGGANQAGINHGVPMKNKLTGSIPQGKVLRIGETGDPATDWAWSNEQVLGMLTRSPGAVPSKSVFGITKLQNIDGFDPSLWRNLEVSIDPLDTAQMGVTMENVRKLKQADPSINIALRIRTLVSRDPEIAGNLAKAKQFAKEMKTPVLETKLRFKNKFAFELLDLDPNAYVKDGPQYKLRQNLLSREEGLMVKVCGEPKPHCKDCRSCEQLMTRTFTKGE